MTSLLSPTFSVTFQKLKWEEPNERSKKPKHPVVLIIANWIQSDCFNEMQSAPQLSFRHSSTRMHIHALLVCSLSFGAHVLQKEAANDRQGTAPSEITKHVHHTLVAGHLKKKKKGLLVLPFHSIKVCNENKLWHNCHASVGLTPPSLFDVLLHASGQPAGSVQGLCGQLQNSSGDGREMQPSQHPVPEDIWGELVLNDKMTLEDYEAFELL